MEKIDSRTLPLAALNERRRRAVKMRLEGVALKEVAQRCEMSPTTVIAAARHTRRVAGEPSMSVLVAARRVQGAA